MQLPALACDCHVHAFGPYARYPLDAARKYTPAEARLEEYRRVMAKLGTGRVVLVQPSVYGVDNSCQRDAIAALGDRARGVAVIDERASAEELSGLAAAGFAGVRLNIMRAENFNSLERLAQRAADVGWHLQLHVPGWSLPEITERLLALPSEFVIDHLGRVDADAGLGQPAFQSLLRLVDSGRCWVKLSAPYRMDLGGAPWRKAAPFARELVRRNPERMIWGTDWPHPDVAEVPEDQGLLDVLLDWVPEEAVRNRILVDNPAKLYGF